MNLPRRLRVFVSRLTWRSPVIPLILGTLVLAGVVAVTTWFLARQESSNAAIRQTMTIDGRLSDLLLHLQDAETGQRGYLLSADIGYLGPYTSAVAALERELPELRETLADNPSQRARLEELEGVVSAKLAELQASIDKRRAGNLGQALAIIRTGKGRELMNQARAILDSMRADEERLINARETMLRGAGRWLQAGVITAILLIAILAALAIRQANQREVLSRFVPAAVAPRLAADDEDLRKGRRHQAAIVFVDMRGSTTIAENLDPERLLVLISSFRRRVTRAAQRHDGLVDKFLGDGALVVFGIPEQRPDDAARALAFARYLRVLIARWNSRRGPQRRVRIGIGVHYGDVFFGIVGDDDRLEFTVLGDAVNVASRLEQATKEHGETILASGVAVDAAGDRKRWSLVTDAPLAGRSERMEVLAPRSLGKTLRARLAGTRALAASYLVQGKQDDAA